MGALSVWLGFRGTVTVLILSTVLVIAASVWLFAIRVARRSTAEGLPGAKSAAESGTRRPRVIPYAIPVAIATWFVIGWNLVRAAVL